VTRLLIGYDGSDSAQAAVAAAGALFGGAETTVANVHPEPPSPGSGAMARIALPSDVIRTGVEEMARQTLEHSRALAEAGAVLANEARLRATAATLNSNRPWRALLEAARDADLLVCGTRGRGAVGRAVLGSTASSLVHHARVPLLVVPDGTHDLGGAVLLGWDDSDGARAALAFAAAHLRERKLIVAHGWRSPVRHTLRGSAMLDSPMTILHDYAEGLDDIFQEVAEDAAERGADAARELGLHAQARSCEARGGDWHALLQGARETGSAAVLVGSRGRGAMTATVLGSVASGLVHAAALPVLVVPEQKETP
jgi:nucleotide-binding universal stress UspA family protein